MILRSWLISLIFFLTTSALAYTPSDKHKLSSETPDQLVGVGITEKLGGKLDLSTEVISDEGVKMPLGDVFKGDLPILFSVVYYNCPTLCNYHLNGLLEGFNDTDLTAGKDFKVVALSMNHREDSDLASLKKDSYLEEYGKKGVESGWHFLTASEENIKKITDQVGFAFKWDEDQQEYSHASAAITISPDGTISRYLHGVGFAGKTLQMAILEAGKGKVGSIIDQIVLYCFQFNPSLNKYTLYAYNLMKIGGALTVLILMLILGPVWFRELKKA